MKARCSLAARGFTLLEMVVVICLVGVLASVLLERMLRYQELAEKAAVEATIGSIRSAEALQLSARILSGGIASASTLAEENPIDWLADPPAGYVGSFYDASIADIPKGTWYFDRKTKELGYRLLRSRFFTPGADGLDRLRYKVVIHLGPVAQAPGIRAVQELTLKEVSEGQWNPEF